MQRWRRVRIAARHRQAGAMQHEPAVQIATGRLRTPRCIVIARWPLHCSSNPWEAFCTNHVAQAIVQTCLPVLQVPCGYEGLKVKMQIGVPNLVRRSR